MNDQKETLFPTRIRAVTQTTDGNPCQWEGKTEDNEHVYARYRYGVLRVSVSLDYFDAVRGAKGDFTVTRFGPDNPGVLTYEDLKHLTVGRFSWPDQAIPRAVAYARKERSR